MPLVTLSNIELGYGRAGLFWGLVHSTVFLCKFAVVWDFMLDSLIKESIVVSLVKVTLIKGPSYGQQECRDTSVMARWKMRGIVPAGSIFYVGKGADRVPIPSYAVSVGYCRGMGAVLSAGVCQCRSHPQQPGRGPGVVWSHLCAALAGDPKQWHGMFKTIPNVPLSNVLSRLKPRVWHVPHMWGSDQQLKHSIIFALH